MSAPKKSVRPDYLAALEYLSGLLGEYVENEYPLEYLLGAEGGPAPGHKDLARLQAALVEADLSRAAQTLGVRYAPNL